MRINQKYFFPLFFIAAAMFVLSGCNLGVSKPGSVLPSETPSIPTDTPMPIFSPTSALTSTPSATLAPTLTATLLFQPSATPTLQWLACPGIVATVTDTDAGDMLHVKRCEDGWEYNFGPLAKGVYAVGPNDKFIIYVSLSGMIYGAKIGDTFMFALFNLKHEKIFTALNMGVEPDFKISFAGDEPNYKLVLIEKNYDQKRVYPLQSRIVY